MNKFSLTLLLLVGILSGCFNSAGTEDEGLEPGEINKWNNSDFDIIGIGAYNYTDDDIYDVFVLPIDKNDIDFAAIGSGGQTVPKNATRWVLEGAAGANFAWDYRWAVPKKFKVLWFRIVDRKAYTDSGNNYNKYTMRKTAPGAAWCEGEINVEHPPQPDKISDLIIHYYPDGHIEGDINQSANENPKVDIKSRDSLPKLHDRACLKEAANPYFGKKKPIAQN